MYFVDRINSASLVIIDDRTSPVKAWLGGSPQEAGPTLASLPASQHPSIPASKARQEIAKAGPWASADWRGRRRRFAWPIFRVGRRSGRRRARSLAVLRASSRVGSAGRTVALKLGRAGAVSASWAWCLAVGRACTQPGRPAAIPPPIHALSFFPPMLADSNQSTHLDALLNLAQACSSFGPLACSPHHNWSPRRRRSPDRPHAHHRRGRQTTNSSALLVRILGGRPETPLDRRHRLPISGVGPHAETACCLETGASKSRQRH